MKGKSEPQAIYRPHRHTIKRRDSVLFERAIVGRRQEQAIVKYKFSMLLEESQNTARNITRESGGLLIVEGPTGSGKVRY